MNEVNSMSHSQMTPTEGQHVAVIFDLDGTITSSDTYLAFLQGYVRRKPCLLVRLPVLMSAWTVFKLRLRSNSWLKAKFLHTLMGGVSSHNLAMWTNDFIEEIMTSRLRYRAKPVIESHLNAKHTVILVTASFDLYVEKLAQKLGISEVICTRAAWDQNGNLTGEIDGKNCYGEEKVRRLMEHFGSSRENLHILGYTDHHSDLGLMRWVDEPIVVNPTKKMTGLAKKFAFKIENWDR